MQIFFGQRFYFNWSLTLKTKSCLCDVLYYVYFFIMAIVSEPGVLTFNIRSEILIYVSRSGTYNNIEAMNRIMDGWGLELVVQGVH